MTLNSDWSERARANDGGRLSGCVCSYDAACIIILIICECFYSILWVGMPIIIVSYRIYRMSCLVRSWMYLYAAAAAATVCVIIMYYINSCAVVPVTIPGAYVTTVFSYKFTFSFKKKSNVLFMRVRIFFFRGIFEPGYIRFNLLLCTGGILHIICVYRMRHAHNALVQSNVNKQPFV